MTSVAVLALAWSAAGSAAPATSAPSRAASEHETPRLAVLDFNVGEDIMDRNMMKERMTEKDFAATTECDEVRCLVRYGKTLDVHKIIGGFATSFGKSWMVTLRMVDVSTGREEKTFSQDCRGDMECLMALSRQGARVLLGLEPDAALPVPAKTPPPATGDVLTLDFGGGVKMDLVKIPAGTFQMGSRLSAEEVVARYGGETKDFEDERPVHEVTISKSFYLGRNEVTVGQFRRFVDDTRYVTDAEKGGQSFEDGKKGGYTVQADGTWGWREDASWRKPGFPQGDDHPVVLVSWNDAVAFCEWLSGKEGKPYRLATEAEWEYACRARTDTAFWWGDGMDTTGKVDNVRDQAHQSAVSPWKVMPCDDGYKFTAPVGAYRANGFGLYDMIGNVSEWCSDWYGAYPAGVQGDPTGPSSGDGRVLRGGSWCSHAAYCRSAVRNWSRPDDRYVNIGFRIAAGTG